jgi:Nif-specific regulatory protein
LPATTRRCPRQSQSKILQLLQSREFYRLGSTRAEVADIRIVAATNRDLEAEVAEKRFREDLYFRLNVVPLRMPGLDEHSADVPLLAEFLLERAVRKYRLPHLRLSPAAGEPVGDLTFQEATRRFQRKLLEEALNESGWNVSGTARRLGLARSHLYDLINAHGLQREYLFPCKYLK